MQPAVVSEQKDAITLDSPGIIEGGEIIFYSINEGQCSVMDYCDLPVMFSLPLSFESPSRSVFLLFLRLHIIFLLNNPFWSQMEDGFTCMQTLHTDTHSLIYKYVCVLTHMIQAMSWDPINTPLFCKGWRKPLRSFLARGHKLFYPSKCVCGLPVLMLWCVPCLCFIEFVYSVLWMLCVYDSMYEMEREPIYIIAVSSKRATDTVISPLYTMHHLYFIDV